MPTDGILLPASSELPVDAPLRVSEGYHPVVTSPSLPANFPLPEGDDDPPAGTALPPAGTTPPVVSASPVDALRRVSEGAHPVASSPSLPANFHRLEGDLYLPAGFSMPPDGISLPASLALPVDALLHVSEGAHPVVSAPSSPADFRRTEGDDHQHAGFALPRTGTSLPASTMLPVDVFPRALEGYRHVVPLPFPHVRCSLPAEDSLPPAGIYLSPVRNSLPASNMSPADDHSRVSAEAHPVVPAPSLPADSRLTEGDLSLPAGTRLPTTGISLPASATSPVDAPPLVSEDSHPVASLSSSPDNFRLMGGDTAPPAGISVLPDGYALPASILSPVDSLSRTLEGDQSQVRPPILPDYFSPTKRGAAMRAEYSLPPAGIASPVAALRRVSEGVHHVVPPHFLSVPFSLPEGDAHPPISCSLPPADNLLLTSAASPGDACHQALPPNTFPPAGNSSPPADETLWIITRHCSPKGVRPVAHPYSPLAKISLLLVVDLPPVGNALTTDSLPQTLDGIHPRTSDHFPSTRVSQPDQDTLLHLGAHLPSTGLLLPTIATLHAYVPAPILERISPARSSPFLLDNFSLTEGIEYLPASSYPPPVGYALSINAPAPIAERDFPVVSPLLLPVASSLPVQECAPPAPQISSATEMALTCLALAHPPAKQPLAMLSATCHRSLIPIPCKSSFDLFVDANLAGHRDPTIAAFDTSRWSSFPWFSHSRLTFPTSNGLGDSDRQHTPSRFRFTSLPSIALLSEVGHNYGSERECEIIYRFASRTSCLLVSRAFSFRAHFKYSHFIDPMSNQNRLHCPEPQIHKVPTIIHHMKNPRCFTAIHQPFIKSYKSNNLYRFTQPTRLLILQLYAHLTTLLKSQADFPNLTLRSSCSPHLFKFYAVLN
jgi:hypothetical protein